jgi:hypothetical protein
MKKSGEIKRVSNGFRFGMPEFPDHYAHARRLAETPRNQSVFQKRGSLGLAQASTFGAAFGFEIKFFKCEGQQKVTGIVTQ